MKSVLFALVTVFFLTSCQTSTPYQNRGLSDNTFGYDELRLDDDLYRVSFKGNSQTTQSQVEQGMLYRAAEVTRQQGYDFFSFYDINSVRKVNVQPVYYRNTYSLTPTIGTAASQVRYTYYSNGFPWSPTAANRKVVDVDDRYQVTGFIKMYKNKPKQVSSLQATEIINTLDNKTTL